jgi:hypothetical protein
MSTPIGAGLSFFLAANTWASVAGANDSAQAPQPPPPHATPIPDARRTVDLEKPGVPIYLDAERPISIDAKALIPTGTYRARVLAPYRGSGWMMLPGFDLQEVSSAFGEACVSRYRALKAVFEAPNADEAVRRRAEFDAGAAKGACPALDPMMANFAKRISPQLTYGIEPVPGGELKLTLERIDATGKVLQTYEWPLVPPVPEAVVTETEWIVGEIAARMANLTTEGATVSVAPREGTPDRFQIKGRDGRTDVEVNVATGVWNPANYVSLARALGVRNSAGDRVYSNDMPDALTTPTVETLLAVNKELGLALRSDPRNRATNEASALLLVAVAMRAANTGLEDIRPLMNRAVAHLALAAAGGSRPGVEAEIALAAIDALSGREVAAAARLQRSRARFGSSSARAWYRALMMRATGDWRIYRSSGQPSLLEQVEHARALSRSWTEDRAADFWRQNGRHPESTLWPRAILKSRTSVELGGELGSQRLRADMAEAAILAQYFGDANVPHWLQEKGETGGLNPISPDLWARLAEGSIADAAWKFNEHLNGLPPSPEGGIFRAQFAEQFPRSLVFQALRAWWLIMQPSPGSDDRCEDLARRIKDEPFRLSARLYGFTAQPCGRLGRAFPAIGERISPWTPAGTLFDYKNRLEAMGLMPSISQSDWASLRKLAFYEPEVLGFAVGSAEQRDPDSADYRTFHQEKAYSLALLRDWRFVTSSRGEVRESLEPGRAACRLDLDECLPLLDLLRSQGLDEEAFATAMRVFSPGRRISVGASSWTVWIVDENARRGHIVAARDIADRAAATGSYVGLLVQARTVERMGDLAEAEHLFERLDETYEREESRSFLLRRLAREGKSHVELARALAEIGRPSKVGMPWGEEVSGLNVSDDWFQSIGAVRHAEAKRMGLNPGYVIVGVNGFEIKNSEQFWAALSLNDDPSISVTARSNAGPGPPIALRGAFWHARYGLIPNRR